MKVVFVKHEGDNKEYVFALQEGQVVSKGDLVFVETAQGKAFGIANSDTEEASETVLLRLGAYLPLKRVRGLIPKEMFPNALEAIALTMKRFADLPF